MDLSVETELVERGTEARCVHRQCAVTRAKRPLSELIRFVIGPDNEVVPDIKCKLPGRGVWITCAKNVLDEAVRKGHFARAFKAKVKVDGALSALVERLLRKAALSRLSLANKAGAVIAGFAKVEQAIVRGDAVGLLHANDGAGDGCSKLDGRYLKSRPEAAGEKFIIRCFNADELSLALGRTNVVHAAIVNDQACWALFKAAAQLEAFASGGAESDGSRIDGTW